MVIEISLSHSDYADNDMPWKHAANEIVSMVTVKSLAHKNFVDNDTPWKYSANYFFLW